jgi:Predicted esterase of the alpha-beta hydrolase superfamily
MTTYNNIENIDEFIDIKLNILLNKSLSRGKTILVLSGGGVKGISFLGALNALEEQNILQNIKIMAGTSIGGLIAGLYLAGYKPIELYRFVELFDAKKLRSLDPSKVLTKFGLDDGTRFNCVLDKMFEAKNIPVNITFKEFFKLTQKKLILTAVCMNDKQVYYLSHLTFPDMPVLLGMRMTSSLPFWFVPVQYNNKLFVDGGCMDNYPIQLFANELDNVIGIYLSENRIFIKNIENVEDFLYNLLQCFFEGVACNSVKGFEKQTIKINLPKVSIMNLDITLETKKELFESGYMAIINNKSKYNGGV